MSTTPALISMRTRLFSPGRPCGPFPSNTEKGFTLIELILVLVIISIAFAIVAPAIGKRLGSSDPKRMAAQLRTTLELLRLRALTDGIEQRLVIDPEDNQYWQESGRQVAKRKRVQHPTSIGERVSPSARDDNEEESDHEDEQMTSSDEDIQLSATSLWVREAGEVEFRFYPDGTNSGGEITIEQQRGANTISYALALNPLLGTATVRKE